MKKILLISAVFASISILILSGCKKDEPYDPSKEMDNYFEGKVNGQDFELSGSWGCLAVSHAYYEDGYPNFDPPFPAGFFSLSFRNCTTDQHLVLGTSRTLSEGVFTSCDT